jgi:hypothetical protein
VKSHLLRTLLAVLPCALFCADPLRAQLAPPNAVVSAVVNFSALSGTLRYRADAETTNRETAMALFSVSNSAFGPSPVAGFCVELEQTISAGTHPFRTTYDVRFGARGSANSGTPTYGMPTGLAAAGGIGSTRAQRINRLFSQYYVPAASATWWTQTLTFTNVPNSSGTTATITVPNARTYAFQLAVWSLAFSDNPGFLASSGGPAGTWGTTGFLVAGNPNDDTIGGTFRVPTSANTGWAGAGGSANSGRALNAVKSLAQAWINDAVANPIPAFAIVLLNDQDSGLPAGSATSLQDLLVPEPSTYAAIAGGLALAGTVFTRRRRC